MSLDLLRQQISNKLIEKIDEQMTATVNQSFRPLSTTQNGIVIPAQSLEEIAVMTLEMNAKMRAYKVALEIVEKAFDDLMKPPAQQSAESKDQDQEGIY
jgi:hypothetical protein